MDELTCSRIVDLTGLQAHFITNQEHCHSPFPLPVEGFLWSTHSVSGLFLERRRITMSASSEPIRDYAFQSPAGTTVRLADFPHKALVLIFLRHLA
jgi:hypothetical protein